MKLDEFIDANRKKKSVFDSYSDDILKLLENDVPQAKIIQYLMTKIKNKNVAGLTQSNLSRWIKRKSSKKSSVAAPAKKSFEAAEPIKMKKPEINQTSKNEPVKKSSNIKVYTIPSNKPSMSCDIDMSKYNRD